MKDGNYFGLPSFIGQLHGGHCGTRLSGHPRSELTYLFLLSSNVKKQSVCISTIQSGLLKKNMA